jgi:hypothetical protein
MEETHKLVFNELLKLFSKKKLENFNAIYFKENIKGIYDVVVDSKGEDNLKNWSHIIFYADGSEEPLIDEIESDSQLEDLLQNIDKKITYERAKKTKKVIKS